jgi:Spy/CpxP family protein refolding chaperone
MKNLLLVILLFTALFAQDRDKRTEMSKKEWQQSKDRKEVMLVAKQTQDLDLKPQQAEKFFPLQNEFHEKAEEAKEAHNKRLRELRSAAKDDRSKFDVDAAIDSKIRMQGTIVRLESKFLKDTKGILSEEQRMKLLFFEERMRNNLSKKIEDRRDKSPNNRRGKRNFDTRRNK